MKTQKQLEAIAKDIVYYLLTQQNVKSLLEDLTEEEAKIVFAHITKSLDRFKSSLSCV